MSIDILIRLRSNRSVTNDDIVTTDVPGIVNLLRRLLIDTSARPRRSLMPFSRLSFYKSCSLTRTNDCIAVRTSYSHWESLNRLNIRLRISDFVGTFVESKLECYLRLRKVSVGIFIITSGDSVYLSILYEDLLQKSSIILKLPNFWV